MSADRFDYLIIGNSTAAVGAIEAIRTRDTDGSIGVVAYESEHTYSRPLITYFMSGKVPEDKVYYRPMDFYDRYSVDRILGSQAVGISTKDNVVILEDGSKIGYSKLLVAAGGSPIPIKVSGADRPGVFFMNTMDDARRAKGWLAHTKRSVVVGAGLTGLKTAEALIEIGQEVTVVELAPRVLATSLDSAASDIVREVMVEHGVDVLTEVQVVSIEGAEDTNDVTSVVLSTGEHIACDSVFVTIGVKPRIEIVQGSGIEAGRGILVDRHMRTNIPNVYAAGDIAEAYDPMMGGSRVVPILPNAYIGGRDLAARPDYNVWAIIASLKRLAARPARWLFPGSGTVRANPAAELWRKAEQMEEFGAQVRRLHAQGLSVREIKRRLLGRETRLTYITCGHFSGANLVALYLRDRPC